MVAVLENQYQIKDSLLNEAWEKSLEVGHITPELQFYANRLYYNFIEKLVYGREIKKLGHHGRLEVLRNDFDKYYTLVDFDRSPIKFAEMLVKRGFAKTIKKYGNMNSFIYETKRKIREDKLNSLL